MMTAPLHHVNQLILHLPTMGGLMASQVSAEEELRRLARLEEARNLHREVVEVVSRTRDTVAVAAIRQEPEPKKEKRRGGRPRAARRSAGPDIFEELGPVEPVVDRRV
ncbi:MAG: hypothetical protein LBP95_05110 [Deltaproteobacteria bacterium]|nr:hypothetical protein [Deltaproteobacteria bacterium]